MSKLLNVLNLTEQQRKHLDIAKQLLDEKIKELTENPLMTGEAYCDTVYKKVNSLNHYLNGYISFWEMVEIIAK